MLYLTNIDIVLIRKTRQPTSNFRSGIEKK